MAIDTSGVTVFGRDWTKCFGAVGIGLGLTAIGYVMLMQDGTDLMDRRARQGGILILPFGALFGLYWLGRLLDPRRDLVRLTPEGIRDIRVYPQQLAWSDITNARTVGSYVILTITRAMARSLPLTLSQKLRKRLRASAGPGHLLLPSEGLKASQTALFEAIEAYRSTYPNNMPRA
ncbi:hypothetical protein [Pseudooceanicola sp.]|uniref:hypothetical protein n=2 Tax=Pseudooceanicola sp. TaxID=1914328 RepID=UPI0035C76E43